MAGLQQGGSNASGGDAAGGGAGDGRDVQELAPGDLSLPPGLTLNITPPAGQDQQVFELARRTADLQAKQIEFQHYIQERELSLRERAQEAELELRRLALDRADENEKAANRRLERTDTARLNFAHRGQTFAIWLAGGSTVALLASGLVCIFLAVAGVITVSLGLGAGGILLAGALFAGIANLIKNFLPGGSGDSGGSGDKSP